MGAAAPVQGLPDTVPRILAHVVGGFTVNVTATAGAGYGVSVAATKLAAYTPGWVTVDESMVTATVVDAPGARSNSTGDSDSQGTSAAPSPQVSYPGRTSDWALAGDVGLAEPPTL